jgi:hypothetical protein
MEQLSSTPTKWLVCSVIDVLSDLTAYGFMVSGVKAIHLANC